MRAFVISVALGVLSRSDGFVKNMVDPDWIVLEKVHSKLRDGSMP